jgi:hypothetical protein
MWPEQNIILIKWSSWTMQVNRPNLKAGDWRTADSLGLKRGPRNSIYTTQANGGVFKHSKRRLGNVARTGYNPEQNGRCTVKGSGHKPQVVIEAQLVASKPEAGDWSTAGCLARGHGDCG